MVTQKATIQIYRYAIKILASLMVILTMVVPLVFVDVQASSSNNLLSDVTFDTGTLNYTFSPNRIYYNLSLPSNTKSVNVSVTPQDNSATYSIAGHTNINQSSSTGKIVVTVTAANGTKKWYTFAIQFSGAATTTKLTTPKITTGTTTTKLTQPTDVLFSIGKLNAAFDTDVTDYTLTLPRDSTEVDVSVVPADISNVMISGNKPLDLNKPEIIITMSSKTYRFAVVFEDVPVSVPTDTTNTLDFGLEFLEVKGYSLNKTFQSDVYEYQIVVDKASSKFEVMAIATDENAMIEVDQDSSRIKVVVSTDVKRATYIIRLLEKSAVKPGGVMASVFQDLLIAIVLLTLAVILFLLSRRVKTERTRETHEDEY